MVAVLRVHQLEPAGPGAPGDRDVLRDVHPIAGGRRLLDPQLDSDLVDLQRARVGSSGRPGRSVETDRGVAVSLQSSGLTEGIATYVRAAVAVRCGVAHRRTGRLAESPVCRR